MGWPVSAMHTSLSASRGDKDGKGKGRPVEDGAGLPSICRGEDCLKAPEARVVSEIDKPEGLFLLPSFPTV